MPDADVGEGHIAVAKKPKRHEANTGAGHFKCRLMVRIDRNSFWISWFASLKISVRTKKSTDQTWGFLLQRPCLRNIACARLISCDMPLFEAGTEKEGRFFRRNDQGCIHSRKPPQMV